MRAKGLQTLQKDVILAGACEVDVIIVCHPPPPDEDVIVDVTSVEQSDSDIEIVEPPPTQPREKRAMKRNYLRKIKELKQEIQASEEQHDDEQDAPLAKVACDTSDDCELDMDLSPPGSRPPSQAEAEPPADDGNLTEQEDGEEDGPELELVTENSHNVHPDPEVLDDESDRTPSPAEALMNNQANAMDADTSYDHSHEQSEEPSTPASMPSMDAENAFDSVHTAESASPEDIEDREASDADDGLRPKILGANGAEPFPDASLKYSVNFGPIVRTSDPSVVGFLNVFGRMFYFTKTLENRETVNGEAKVTRTYRCCGCIEAIKRQKQKLDVPLVKTVNDIFVERDPDYPLGNHHFCTPNTDEAQG